MNIVENYVTCDLGGRLGNQLFMIAHAYSKSLQYNRKFYIPRKSNAGHCGIEAYIPNIYKKFDIIDTIPKDGIYNPSNPSEVNGPIIYAGYYQGEKYFEKYSETIKSLFSCPSEYMDEVYKKYPQLKTSRVTSIHVRRGDYLHYKDVHPVLSKEYVKFAMGLVPETDYYFVASDDMDWCKQNIMGNNVIFVENCQPHEQLWIMQLCHNFIIANSTFSWWGAYLSYSKNKRVLAPSIWFAPQTIHKGTDLYCNNWEKIDSKFYDGIIYPNL